MICNDWMGKYSFLIETDYEITCFVRYLCDFAHISSAKLWIFREVALILQLENKNSKYDGKEF